MNTIEILLLGIALAADACAVAACKGLTTKGNIFKSALIIGSYFGFFQALMPLLGFFLGNNFGYFVDKLGHIVAFILLTLIGINMIKERNEDVNTTDSLNFKEMIGMAIATSIDALVTGITFSILHVNIIVSSIIIGIITLLLCFIATVIGSKAGEAFGSKAKLIGGVVIIIIGIKILLEHLS